MLRNMLLIVLFFPFGISGCVYENSGNLADKKIVTEERQTDIFTGLKLIGSYVVQLENADSCFIRISAPQDFKNEIIAEVVNEVLIVRALDESRWKTIEGVELYISAPGLESIEVLASAKIFSENTFVFERLDLQSSGAIQIDMALEGKFFQGEFLGASNLKLEGKVDDVQINMPGAGKISAYDLKAKNLKLNLSGAGKAEVYASNKLFVDLSGACMVNYKGNPDKVFSNITGLGRVKQAD